MFANATQPLKIKSQGYWFESNRGSKTAAQRLGVLNIPDKMCNKRSRFVCGPRRVDLGRAWYLSRRDHAGERRSAGTLSLAHRPTDVTGTAAHGPHREQSGLPPIVRLVAGRPPS